MSLTPSGPPPTASRHEERLLIDGELREAADSGTFEVLNPADGTVLGKVADAGRDDMLDAIAAARRAFDETDWAVDRQLRKRALTQLLDALVEEKEELREELIAEVGAPRMLTYGAQLQDPLQKFQWHIDHIDQFEWVRRLDDAVNRSTNEPTERWVVKEPVGVVAAITPGTSPSGCCSSSSPALSPPATPSSRSPRPRHRGTPPASVGSSPSAPTSRPAWSTW